MNRLWAGLSATTLASIAMVAIVLGVGSLSIPSTRYLAVSPTATSEPILTVRCDRGWDEEQVCNILTERGSSGMITANGEPVFARVINVDDIDDRLPSGFTERQLLWMGAVLVASSIGVTAFQGLVRR